MKSTMRMVALGAIAMAIGIAGSAVGASMITGKQIKNGSIGLIDLSPAARHALQGRRGPQGLAGPAGRDGRDGQGGPAGMPGKDGADASPEHVIVSDSAPILANTDRSLEVQCPAGMVVVGGGAGGGRSDVVAGHPPDGIRVVESAPASSGRAWIAHIAETTGETDRLIEVYAICEPGEIHAAATPTTSP